jgi:3-oxoadipate enol-lactonase
MPFIDANGADTYYELAGASASPALVFSNSLGTNFTMWDMQTTALGSDFEILRYDTRGHGSSGVTPGPYTIGQLTDDVLSLLDRLEIEQANFCGLSMGGMIGMTLALRAPDRVRKLVLCNTAPKIGTVELWNTRISTVQQKGMAGLADAVIERWYTPEFRKKSPEQIEATREMLLQTAPDGYAACCAAIRDTDLWKALPEIRVPTMVILGKYDPVIPLEQGPLMADRIPGARYVELPAAHLSNIETSEEFTRELTAFLKS